MRIKIEEGFPIIEVVIKCPEHTSEVTRMAAALQIFDKKLSGTKDNHTHVIEHTSILYFESVDKRCFIYTTNDIYETPAKLYELEERLSDIGFFRCSKSQIVNIAKIKSLCPDFGGRVEATMENDEKIIISRQYAKSLKERLGLI